jgi:putative membrane protein
MKENLFLAAKGMLMGAANVIPGVSGGTMALLTGIFEELILALRSFDLAALNLLRKGRFRELAEHIHASFLLTVGIGIAVSVLSFARLLDFLFEHHALYVWSFFFGLILVSVYFVWKRIRVRNAAVFLFFLVGTLIAAALVFVRPAGENSSFFYLFLCGAVAMCSMILPGLSGSYVLLLMGNYQLVMVDAVAHLRLEILLPVGLGAAAGLAAFARLLSWVFARFHDATTALLAGFIFGSLCVLWPWKTALTQTFGEKEKVIGYDYIWPALSAETAVALGIMALGMVLLVLIEKTAGKK